MTVNEEKNSAIPTNETKPSVELNAAPSFTPGPWKAVIGRWTDDNPIFGFAIRCADDAEHKRRNELSIASIGLAEPNVSAGASYSQGEFIGNARLIAAAPALYEALIALEPYLSTEAQLLDAASLNEGRASGFDMASVKARKSLALAGKR